ncbi:membrane integrity-associated transporter subunit PqiC [Photobacterium sp. TY1-4]|uniref:PqiC family protein n=1 Tax=Photobacterium sp. TY1-4 TaxID=2899122 RepID=UPI0021BF5B5B|nr:ABC-type transport auxiliary lipoprotein family protein [Photobacterium sp. TY1-4]UXI03779.1 ABC-type transport auxiliary lipoprotein family protein [Photobacterium sp. TY1-4]
MMQQRIWGWGIGVLLLLVGCSSEPTAVSSTYILPVTGSPAALQQPVGRPILVVRPVEMAAHLSGNGLVYQLSDAEVVQAQQNLWAESIQQQLTRRINLDLRRKQTRYWPTELTPALETMNAPRVQVRFTQFNGHYTGVAQVAGEWLLLDAHGGLQGGYPFQYQVPLEQAGYVAQVNALAAGVDRLTSDIANRLGLVGTATAPQ